MPAHCGSTTRPAFSSIWTTCFLAHLNLDYHLESFRSRSMKLKKEGSAGISSAFGSLDICSKSRAVARPVSLMVALTSLYLPPNEKIVQESRSKLVQVHTNTTKYLYAKQMTQSILLAHRSVPSCVKLGFTIFNLSRCFAPKN